MAAPSKNWSNIADTQIDADSPLDTTLLTEIRDNLVHLEEWVGDSYTAAKDHRHNGTDSAQINDADLSRSGGVVMFDDFLFESFIGWQVLNLGASLVSGDNGVVQLNIASTSTACGIASSSTIKSFKLSGNTITVELRIKQPSAAFRYCVLGLTDDPVTLQGRGANNIAFYRENGGAWQANTRASSTDTTTTLVDSPSSSYQTLKFVATPTSVEFFVDGVSRGTHSTNIPTVSMTPIFVLWSGVETGALADIDYIECRMDRI